MRTKTLLLSAVLGALSGASLMAQVYSLNAVGYINVTLAPGLTQLADQLYVTNGQPNYISPTLDSQLGSNPGFVGSRIYKYNPTTQTYLGWRVTANSQLGYNNTGAAPEAALTGVAASTVTINPGEALWFYNSQNTNLTLTFVGTVASTNANLAGLTNQLAYATGGAGLQMVSSIVPISGQIDTVLGIAPVTGDYAYIYDTATENYGGFKWNGTAWRHLIGTNTAPTVNVGQGFWYIVGTAGTTNEWVQEFGVNE